MIDFKGKKVLIAGLGISGQAVLEALSKREAYISVCDNNDIEVTNPRLFKKLELSAIPAYLNGREVPDEKWDYVIISPGIPLTVPFVENAEKQGSKIIGELELAYELVSGTYIGITGTNGKTTTTTLVGEIFKNAGRQTIVGGNIGTPLVSSAGNTDENTVIVSEISSFQLETTRNFKPYVSAILNLTPDHMDRHKTMENYGATKGKIFKNQDMEDYLIYNYDDERVRALVEKSETNKIPFSTTRELEVGAFVKDKKIYIKNLEKQLIEIIETDKLLIPGKHNLENALAATAITYFSGVDKEVIARELEEFEGVSHRLELVRTRKGIRFVNDSKGTNPDAAMKAIEAVDKDIFLIAGGYNKESDFDQFIKSFDHKVKHLLLIGETKEEIKAAAERLGFNNITMCENMADCVRLGYEYANEGDTVLLSPACASWDMYKNFEERGNHFKKIVEELE